MATEVDTTLRFRLDLKSGVPYYKQVILQVEKAIVDGRLQNGDQLPTVRKLAVELKINPNTVARAYNELEIRGIVNTQQGTGTFISDKKIELTEVEKERILSELTHPYISNARAYGFTLEDLIKHLQSMAI
ncbi:MAG: GntR family transcriptional regulator [Spirochaetaceae bacterium]|nr:GntR family transcriptional regulator [Spirochaetaceae bacterium]